MAWSFGDGWDCYAAPADAANGYWDSFATSPTLLAGRFSGSQCLHYTSSGTSISVKTSAVNDAVHHLVLAFRQSAALTGTTLGFYLQLTDGVTAQCSVVFRSDGAILFTSGGPAGTVLDTYTGAVAAINTWYAFEVEIVINNTTGSWAVRKNGNTSNDRALGSLNTRVSANNYANKLQTGMNTSVSAQDVDDLFWRSDASSVAWMGDIRCITRMPASDASTQFARTPTNYQQPTNGGIGGGSTSASNGAIRYIPFTAAYTGSVGSLTVTVSTTSTANWKCALYNNAGSGGAPGTVLGTATPFSSPGVGAYTINFPSPVSVTAGSVYWIGIGADTNSGQLRLCATSIPTTYVAPVGYAAFPVNNPAVSAGSGTDYYYTANYSPSANSMMVSEAQQDAATSYVYDSTPGDADFYTIGAIASTPVATIAVTTRAYMQKSDAGSRTAAVQIKSGATTVASPTLTLTTSGWLWAWRTDVTDPATGAAWTAAAVNNAQCGPKVIA